MSTELNRREVVGAMAIAGVAAAIGLPRTALASSARTTFATHPFLNAEGELTLPPLPYAFADLEPHIDAETMEIHHDRHHKAYVDNANKALAGTPWAGKSPTEIIANLDKAPADKKTILRNNVGGHVNHTLFWLLMAPVGKAGPASPPTGELAAAITAAFGSFDGKDGFKDQFAKAATGRFGSGWAWIVVKDKKLAICSTANQDSPLMGDAIAGCSGSPILGLDVWEHAYYLKYRNKRADYITNWWNVVNWAKVSELYAIAMK